MEEISPPRSCIETRLLVRADTDNSESQLDTSSSEREIAGVIIFCRRADLPLDIFALYTALDPEATIVHTATVVFASF